VCVCGETHGVSDKPLGEAVLQRSRETSKLSNVIYVRLVVHANHDNALVIDYDKKRMLTT